MSIASRSIVLAFAFAFALAASCTSARAPSPSPSPSAPPREVVSAFGLSPFYAKYVDADGLPVVASSKVSGYALLEARYLIQRMVARRPEILRAIVRDRVRFTVIGASELTTDIPEYATLAPKEFWDRRARGLGATPERPAVSCGEENLLDLPGDPYAAENILVHELAHTVHEIGMRDVDPTFDARLAVAYERAMGGGLWKDTYASRSRQEYWAEGAQSWFDCNRSNDAEHGPIDTREELKAYDPGLAALLAEVFGDGPWRYTKPSRRPPVERAHLAGFDPRAAGRFVRPPHVASAELAWLAPDDLPRASPAGPARTTTVLFVNRRRAEVSIAWIDFDGAPRPYARVPPGGEHAQATFAGHVWLVTETDGSTRLGGVVAAEVPGRADVR